MTAEASREAVAFEPDDIMELAQIIVDHDEQAAYEFLKERVYKRIVSAQAMRLEHARLGRRGGPHDKA